MHQYFEPLVVKEIIKVSEHQRVVVSPTSRKALKKSQKIKEVFSMSHYCYFSEKIFLSDR